jgi:hypothetical protein
MIMTSVRIVQYIQYIEGNVSRDEQLFEDLL